MDHELHSNVTIRVFPFVDDQQQPIQAPKRQFHVFRMLSSAMEILKALLFLPAKFVGHCMQVNFIRLFSAPYAFSQIFLVETSR